jgi:hypothetical protein
MFALACLLHFKEKNQLEALWTASPLDLAVKSLVQTKPSSLKRKLTPQEMAFLVGSIASPTFMVAK